jgi:TonB-linked SusC/RagA family outer membrane protein
MTKMNFLQFKLLTLVFIWAIAPASSGQALAVNIPEYRNSPQKSNIHELTSLLTELEKQGKKTFFYESKLVEGKVVEVNQTEFKSFEEKLSYLLSLANLYFKKLDSNTFLILKDDRPRKDDLLMEKKNAGTSGQAIPASSIFNLPGASKINQILTGKVTDDKGEALAGVNIIVKGTTNGTTTDAAGVYSIDVPDENSILIFSFIGYVTEEITVGKRTSLDIALLSDIESLTEVVVVGYGEKNKATVTGSITTLQTKEVQDIPAANLSTLLQGRMAGVSIGQSSGRPGAATSIQIRTPGSWNNQPPLFVIDGFIRDQQAFDLLDPTEVESVSVLKDAAAAIYGARAAGGVILVKTKRGKEGKPTISYSGSYGASEATQFTDMLSAYDQAVLINDALKITKPTGYEKEKNWRTDDELEYYKTLHNNWLEQAWQASSTSRHTVNVRGGSEKVRYFGGASYYDEKGNLPGTRLQKYTLRLGIDADITKDLTASLTLSNDYKLDEVPFNTDDNTPDPMDGTFKALLQSPRWLPAYIDGKAVGQFGTVVSHPFEVNNKSSYHRTKGSNTVINAALEYRIPVVKGLSVRAAYSQSEASGYAKQHRVAYNLYNFKMEGGNSHIFTNEVDGNPVRIKNDERIAEIYDRGRNYQFNGSIAYDRKFGLHDINALVVYEQSESEGNSFTALREQLLIPGYERQEGFSEAQDVTSSGESAGSRLSYIGRINYGFANKYLLEAAFRYEGSIKFRPENRWGFFPSVSAAWRVSEERFFRDNISFINNLKLRASAGLVGNDDVGTRQYELSYGITTGSYLGGTAITNALNPRNSGVIATSVTWEKTKTYNGGIDIGLLHNINITFDGYYRQTYDILDDRNSTLPTSTGINKMPKENYGKMDSWGFDASINYNFKVLDQVNFNVGTNIAWARSKILQRFQSEGVIGTWEDLIGKMPGGEVGFISKGIIRTQGELDAILAANPDYKIFGKTPELGMLNYEDVGSANHSNEPDGKIDDNDRRIIAPTVSALGFNFNLGASWKGFKVSAVVGLGGFGNKVFYDKEAMKTPIPASNGLTLNGPSFWKDHWTPENPDAAYPRAANYGGDGERSTFWMKDGLSMNLTTVNASYDLPKSISSKFKIPQIRIYFAGRNLWRIINPIGYKDPSISRFNSYPTLKTYNFGLNITI